MNTRNLRVGRRRPALMPDSLTAVCEPIVYKMWRPRRLTTLWISTACYRDSFVNESVNFVHHVAFRKEHISETETVSIISLKAEEAHTNLDPLERMNWSNLQVNGPIRHVETCPEFFFLTARVHTTKSTVKILAANTHCKYFLKIAFQE
jgi:hypothetical protein